MKIKLAIMGIFIHFVDNKLYEILVQLSTLFDVNKHSLLDCTNSFLTEHLPVDCYQ